jgi:HPt (histidine-containing phosphotransfer) domain-containing protein
MTLDKQSEIKSPPDISAVLNQLWTKFLPEIYERVATLESAAQASAAGNMTQEHREAAHSAAHKLAGSLGTFSLPRGTELAREFEQACVSEKSYKAAQSGRLTAIAAEIRTIIDSRK